MSWPLVFDGGPLDGHERTMQGQPPAVIVAAGAPPYILNLDPDAAPKAEPAMDIEGRVLVPLPQLPHIVCPGLLARGEWVAYTLQTGADLSAIRYRLTDESSRRR